MIAYDVYGMIAATIGAYIAYRLYHSSVWDPLVYPFVSLPRYEEQHEPRGRCKLFASYIATNLLLLTANLTIMSYIYSTYVISAGKIIIFYVVGGGLVFRIRLRAVTDREAAFRVLGTYCLAFMLALLARISIALFVQEASFPLVLGTFTLQDVVGVFICFVTVPFLLVTLGEYVATRR